MKLSNGSSDVVALFNVVYQYRVREWSLNSEPYKQDLETIEWYRISQAQAYAELELFKTPDLYDVLQEIFDTGYKGENLIAFAAYIVNVRGLPNPMTDEPALISQDLHQ